MNGTRRAFVFIGVMIAIFIVFFLLMTRKSVASKAIAEIETCNSIEDVKGTWYKYRTKLSDNEDYCQAVREKIKTFRPDDKVILDIKEWLPPKTTSLNIIIVPDLSHRRLKVDRTTIDSAQVNHDKAIIIAILNEFKNQVRLKQDAKDRFIIDVTDNGQGGEFRDIANNLMLDLSAFKNQLSRNILKLEEPKILTNLDALYAMAVQHPAGADFGYFFGERLTNDRLLESNIDEEYRNIVVIVSDGYYQKGANYPYGTTNPHFKKFLSSGDIKHVIAPDQRYPTTEVYIFELDKKYDDEIGTLKRWWQEWFRKMEFRNSDSNPTFVHNDNIQLTLKNIKDIFHE